MSGRKKKHEEHENEERWLLTYADLITLLMVFFVVMYSMSVTDSKKFQALAASLQSTLGKPTASPTGIGGHPIPNTMTGAPPKPQGESRKHNPTNDGMGDQRRARMRHLKEDLQSLLKSKGMEKSVNLQLDPSGNKLTMGLSDSLFFEGGSADLTSNAQELVARIGDILAAREYDVNIQGHTDNVPIHNARYSSNFQLSTDRAVNVIDYLMKTQKLPASRLSASGYGEYHPVASNDTPEGRAQNRRVDFVIYDSAAGTVPDASTPDVKGASETPTAATTEQAAGTPLEGTTQKTTPMTVVPPVPTTGPEVPAPAAAQEPASAAPVPPASSTITTTQ